MKRDWAMSTGLKGQWVHLYELDLRARIWSVIEDKVCFCNILGYDWLFKIPTGRLKWEEDGDGRWLENSLGSLLYDIESRISERSWRHRDKCEVAKIDITREQMETIAPKFAALWDPEEEL